MALCRARVLRVSLHTILPNAAPITGIALQMLMQRGKVKGSDFTIDAARAIVVVLGYS